MVFATDRASFYEARWPSWPSVAFHFTGRQDPGDRGRMYLLYKENFDGKLVWEREVSVFDLNGHATAKLAYTWAEEGSGGRVRFVAVPHTEKVNSPAGAVRAVVAQQSRG